MSWKRKSFLFLGLLLNLLVAVPYFYYAVTNHQLAMMDGSRYYLHSKRLALQLLSHIQNGEIFSLFPVFLNGQASSDVPMAHISAASPLIALPIAPEFKIMMWNSLLLVVAWGSALWGFRRFASGKDALILSAVLMSNISLLHSYQHFMGEMPLLAFTLLATAITLNSNSFAHPSPALGASYAIPLLARPVEGFFSSTPLLLHWLGCFATPLACLRWVAAGVVATIGLFIFAVIINSDSSECAFLAGLLTFSLWGALSYFFHRKRQIAFSMIAVFFMISSAWIVTLARTTWKWVLACTIGEAVTHPTDPLAFLAVRFEQYWSHSVFLLLIGLIAFALFAPKEWRRWILWWSLVQAVFIGIGSFSGNYDPRYFFATFVGGELFALCGLFLLTQRRSWLLIFFRCLLVIYILIRLVLNFELIRPGSFPSQIIENLNHWNPEGISAQPSIPADRQTQLAFQIYKDLEQEGAAKIAISQYCENYAIESLLQGEALEIQAGFLGLPVTYPHLDMQNQDQSIENLVSKFDGFFVGPIIPGKVCAQEQGHFPKIRLPWIKLFVSHYNSQTLESIGLRLKKVFNLELEGENMQFLLLESL